MPDIERYVDEHEPDIITLTEVKPKNCKVPLQETELRIEGYHPPVHNLDAEGRGICIYVSSQFGLELLKIDDENSLNFNESVWVKVIVDNRKTIVLGCVYRSPSSGNDNNRGLEKLLRHISDMNFHDLIIVGDFNYPDIDWENCVADRENSDSDLFAECVKDCFLIQHVDEPTRYRGNQRPSILDLVMTNEENVISDLQYHAPFGNSDHCCLAFEYKCIAETKSTKTKKYKYDKGDYVGMRENLSSIDWTEELKDQTTQEAWDIFSGILDTAMQTHIPTHTGGGIRKLKRQSYMDKQGMRLAKAKQRAWKRFTDTEDPHDYQKYCTARNKLRSYTRELRKNFEEELARDVKVNPKAFWKYASSKLTVKSGVSDLKDSEGNLHGDDSSKAEILNEFFCSVFTKEDVTHIPDLDDRSEGHELLETLISEEMIMRHLQKLKISKSSGPDSFHPRVLKEVAEAITPHSTSYSERVWILDNCHPSGSKDKLHRYLRKGIGVHQATIDQSVLRQ
ncbi:uncharacterized protein LOC128221661 [Mya arenaria]|uniref:uncharacterized protein LOC128221661 n=1 Tax=Mya arenaria TaxID=6604 RepID=UPI0022E0D3AB|nr:uncharacterized protein LOC128221661 [Mya arenaria]